MGQVETYGDRERHMGAGRYTWGQVQTLRNNYGIHWTNMDT